MALAAAAVLAAGEASAPQRGPTLTELPVSAGMPADALTLTSVRHRLRVTYPRSWHVGRGQLLPLMARPGAILAVGTFPPHPQPRRACSHAPDFPQLSVGPRQALVVVEEDTRGLAWLAPDRPRRFRLLRQLRRVEPGERGRQIFPWHCLNRAGIAGLWSQFGDAGRLLTVTAIVGRKASARVQREALAVLQRLEFHRREHSITTTPTVARPRRSVEVRLVSGTSTGIRGRRWRRYYARVRGPARPACAQDTEAWFELGAATRTLTAVLDPRRTKGGHWCRGTFRGRISLRYGFACPPQGECHPPPGFARHSERVGSFGFEVR